MENNTLGIMYVKRKGGTAFDLSYTQASQGITEINENVSNSNQKTTNIGEGVRQVEDHSIEVKESSEHYVGRPKSYLSLRRS